MKKIKLGGKLNLNKQTVLKLNDEQMETAKGGLMIHLGTGCVCGKSQKVTCGIICVDGASGHPATITNYPTIILP